MQYQSVAQNVPMIIPLTVENFKRNSVIRKIRLSLLMVLSIQLVLSGFYFCGQIVSFLQYYNLSYGSDNRLLAIGLTRDALVASISLIFITVFIIMVVKYPRIDIVIFAWLIVIKLIIMFITFFLQISAISTFISSTNDIKLTTTDAVIYIIVACIVSVLQILDIVFSFKLAALIETWGIHPIVGNLNN